MGKIKGKYYIRLHTDYGFCLPGEMGSRTRLWTDAIRCEDDGSITFEPINTTSEDEWPITINIHISNCVIFKMKNN